MRRDVFPILLQLYIRSTPIATAFTHSQLTHIQSCRNKHETRFVLALCERSHKDDRNDSITQGNTDNDMILHEDSSSSKSNSRRFPLGPLDSIKNGVPNIFYLPPIEVEETSILFYDVFLLLNLSLSISFWVAHRMQFGYIVPAFNEGALLSILWILSGLYYGTFLHSSINGHYDSDRGGPRAAGTLALSTFITTASLRIMVALASAFFEHRPVGVGPGEELIPLEIGFGLVLMSTWRFVWSEASQY